ncbi:MAG TPA: flippase-like domain-containing protein, partial [Solirubrobacterales bacterium]|nr:flippase-like domain-containing protein [Solirubrobacterales bacterium]
MSQTQRVGTATPAGSGPGRAKLLLGGLAFGLLTLGALAWQFWRIPPDVATPRVADLSLVHLLLILLVLPVETVAAALRIRLLCGALGSPVGFWPAVQAEWANAGISILTPSQSGGGPGQIYMLSRAGVSVPTALTVSLISFLGTTVGLTLMGAYAIVSGLAVTSALLAALAALAAIGGTMLAAALVPDAICGTLGAILRTVRRLAGRVPPGDLIDRLDRLTARLCDVVYTYRDNVRRFLRVGKTTFAWVCLLSLTFLAARCLLPYLILQVLGLRTATLGEVVEAQVVLIFLVFFAP